MQVARTHTPLPIGALRTGLRRAFRQVTGSPLGQAEPYALALLVLENRRGDAIYNHNWGNVILGRGSGDYYKHDDNPLAFRSYPSHDAGARGFVQTLLNSSNRAAFDAASRDDFEEFFRQIRDHYAAPPPGHPKMGPEHRATYRSLVDEFRGLRRTETAKAHDGAAVVFFWPPSPADSCGLGG